MALGPYLITKFLNLPRAVGWEPTFFSSETLIKMQTSSKTMRSTTNKVKNIPAQVPFSVELMVCDLVIEKYMEPVIAVKMRKKPREKDILSHGDNL